MTHESATAGAEAIGVLLLDEQVLWREFLTEYVNGLPGYRVVGSTDRWTDALPLFASLQPRLVIVALMSTEPALLNAAAALKVSDMGANVLVVSANVQPEWVQEAVSAGVSGLVDTSIDLSMLRQAIEKVSHGGEYFSPRVSSILTELLRRRAQPGDSAPLTFRECQVLREVARGKISKEMAAALGLSVFTIENIRRRIMQKTGLHSVAALTLHAMKLRLISGERRDESVLQTETAELP
jgi:DNA-binding NarL/FixJ family response regulator